MVQSLGHTLFIFTLPQKVTEMNEQVLKPQKTKLLKLRLKNNLSRF